VSASSWTSLYLHLFLLGAHLSKAVYEYVVLAPQPKRKKPKRDQISQTSLSFFLFSWIIL